MEADFTVVTVAFGDKYKQFVPSWWESILNLNTKPKEVIVVHNPQDDTGVADLPVKLIPVNSCNFTEMTNMGFKEVKTKWTGSLSLDDQYKSDSLEDIKYANNFDIIGCNGINMSNGEYNSSNLEAIRDGNNYMLGFSFFTKQIYAKVGGWPNIYWSDWGFWWLCYKSGARFTNSMRAEVVINDLFPGRISTKNILHANEEMKKFMKENH